MIGLEVPPDEQRTTLERLRVRRLRRLGRHRADLARARRHPRGRPDRGGRAAAARPHPATRCRSAGTCAGASRRSSACAASSRTRSSAPGSPRRTRGASSPRDPSPDAIRLPNPMTLGSGDPANDDRARARRGGAHGRRRGRRRTSRSSRSHASTSLGRAAPRRALAGRRRSSTGGYAASRASPRRSTPRSALELAGRARRRTPLLHPGKAAETEAGWLGELHPTLLEGVWGAFELDLETLFAAVPERIVYEDVITYPAVLQDIAVAVDEDVEVGALVDAAREAAGDAPARGARLRRLSRRPGRRGAQVGRDPPRVPVARADADRGGGDGARERIVAALAERFGAELRA